jgi:hypothetical protein
LRPTWEKHKTLFEKITKTKGAGGVAQEVEHFPSKQEALKLISSTAKKEKSM